MPDSKDDRPWWDKALDVLRHEEVAFRALLWIIAIALAIAIVVLGVRAI